MEARSLQSLKLFSSISLLCLPRLFLGFGTDEDAWTGARAADMFFQTGHYRHSRLPGNPLFEYLLAPIVPSLGPGGTNLFVFASFLVCLALFARLARDRQEGELLTVLFALTPILLVNAVSTMDYVPGLALMLGAWLCVARGRVLPASLLLGLSVGFRLSNALFVLPLAASLLATRDEPTSRRLRQIVLLSAVSGLVGFSFYVPIFLTVGWRMFTIPASVLPLSGVLLRTGYNALMLFGPLATLGIGLVLALNARRIVQVVRRELEERSPAFMLELTSVAVFGVLYLRHSDEVAYLIPAVPFLYLLLARWVPRPQLLLIAGLIFSYTFVGIELKGGESGRRQLTFRPAWGAVVKDYLERREIERLREGVMQFCGPEGSVILTGMAAELTYRNPQVVPSSAAELSPSLEHEVPDMARLKDRNVFLVYDLPLEDVERLTREGHAFYVFSALAPTVALHKHGYDPYRVAQKLDVLDVRAFYKQ